MLLFLKSVKNKYIFRQLLKNQYPKLHFELIHTNDIEHYKCSSSKFIKSVMGCFGTGVHCIGPKTDFRKLAENMNQEIKKICKYYLLMLYQIVSF